MIDLPTTNGWERYVGRRGAIIGAVPTKFGLTLDHVVSVAREQSARHAR
jgi:hypothetical protein